MEGAGDLGALPVLLRSHLQKTGEFRDVLGKPVPAHGRNKALVRGGLEGYVATAGSRPGCVGVLVVLDSEGDCLFILGRQLLARACVVIGKPVRIALAKRNFESWLYASAESLEIGLTYDPLRDGQSAIASALKPAKYVKTIWQPRLAHRLNINVAIPRSQSLVSRGP